MRKSIRIYTLILFVCIMLCGCTRREQLVLKEVSEEKSSSEQQILQEDKTEEQNAAKLQSSEEQNTAAQKAEPQTIYVHVCGAVENPNVYELPAGSRVYEAVQKAGGFTEDADESYVNQAQPLSDGVKLVIPTVEQTQAMITGNAEVDLVGIVGEQDGVQGISASVQDSAASSDGKININTASEEELCNIPGIGATRAAAIIAYRQEKGGFSAVEDIMNVSGIKEGTYEKIKDSIKVN